MTDKPLYNTERIDSLKAEVAELEKLVKSLALRVKILEHQMAKYVDDGK